MRKAGFNMTISEIKLKLNELDEKIELCEQDVKKAVSVKAALAEPFQDHLKVLKEYKKGLQRKWDYIQSK